jgi:peptide deformylase
MSDAPIEPYKEEISSLLSLVRLALVIMAGLAGVGLGANQIGIMP